MSNEKTNAMRILDKAKLSYEVLSYPHGKDAVDGMQVASILQQDPSTVFKTLVTLSNTKEYLVFVVPVAYELDLKKGAKVAGVKHIEMIHVKDIQKITGYIRGGCSPIGMKKAYRTFFHESCLSYSHIMFSAGKIGLQLKMHPQDVITLIDAHTSDIIRSL
ncbi:MAG: Cys-tRNA(Pro) deacylase [Longicatena sp.]